MRVNSSRLILEVLISLFAGISSANSEQTCDLLTLACDRRVQFSR